MSEHHHDHHDHDHDHPPGGGSHFSEVELRASVRNITTLRRRWAPLRVIAGSLT